MGIKALRTGVVAGAAGLLAAIAAPLVPAATEALPAPTPFVHLLTVRPTAGPCNAPPSCYEPTELRAAYNMGSLYSAGLSGQGQTIAIVDSFGSPTIVSDLHTFDAAFGIPDPTLTIIHPAGPIPPFQPTSDRILWATETTLDVEWAHAMAPLANILLVETPVSETEGVQGFPQIVKAENYVINHNLATVISQSFGATEETFPNPQAIMNLRSAYKNAANKGVSVLASSGDTGATNYMLDGHTLYTHRVNSWPSSDPLVTSVGGTLLDVNGQGVRAHPDVVWNDGSGAGGGGVSSVFARPSYQNSVSAIVGRWRGTPDVSLSSAPSAGADIYAGFQGAGGWGVIGGTSEASPLFAGIVAIADQKAGHGLGLLNTALYASMTAAQGEIDVTQGNNSFGGVTGYQAVTGYDLASGLGTVDAFKLVHTLAP